MNDTGATALQNTNEIADLRHQLAEQRQTVEALTAAKDLYQDFFDLAPDMLFSVNVETQKIIHCNQTMVNQLGYEKRELIGCPTLDLYHPNSIERAKTSFDIFIETGELHDVELEVLRKDASTIYVSLSASAVYDESDQICYSRSIWRDITDRKQAEKYLAQYAARLSMINDIGGRIAAELDLNKVMVQAARLVRKTFDYHHVALFLVDGDQLHLKAVSGAYKAYFPAGYVQKLEEGITGWVATHGQKLVANDVSQEPRYTLLIAEYTETQAELCVPITVADQVAGILDIQSPQVDTFSHQDVMAIETLSDQIAVAIKNAQLYDAAQQELVQRRQIEVALANEQALLSKRVAERTAELSAANAELARAARLKDEFLANMSHELRTPLNAVLGMAEILREQVYGALNEQQLNLLGHISESGRHLLLLINDILDLSKIEANKLKLNIQPLSVKNVGQASLQFIRTEAAQKEIKLVADFPETEIMLPADEKRLKQILINLLSNAVKFTPEKGQVGLEVKADWPEAVIRFSVWDTGIGIKSEKFDHLFEPFMQLDGALARQYDGSGLGLSLVARLTELHGGGVLIESEPDVGSRFTVSLPWRGDEQFAEEPHAHYSSDAVASLADLADGQLPTDQTNPLLLILDENEISLELIQSALQTTSFRIRTTRAGTEALNRIGEIDPDLIIVDIGKQVASGLKLIGRLKAETAAAPVPIIVTTAVSRPKDRQRCLQAGADAYLSKPPGLQTLIKLIAQQLGGQAHTPTPS